MSLNTKLSDLVSAVALNLNDSRTWSETEFTGVYNTIDQVVAAIPTSTSQLSNDSGYITGISNITQIGLRSYNDLQNLPPLNITNWNVAHSWGDHALAGYLKTLPEHNHDTLYEGKLSSPDFDGQVLSSDTLGNKFWVDAPVITNITQIANRSYNDLQDLPVGSNETAESIKTKYESNADTNAYTDMEKAKVGSLPANVESVSGSQTKANTAETNANLYTDGQISTHTHPQYVGGINGLTGLWVGTQIEYDALTPDVNVVYYIV